LRLDEIPTHVAVRKPKSIFQQQRSVYNDSTKCRWQCSQACNGDARAQRRKQPTTNSRQRNTSRCDKGILIKRNFDRRDRTPGKQSAIC
jgi:hypothetical protein